MMKRFPILLLVILGAILACSQPEENLDVFTVAEVYQTERDEGNNIDSPSVWHGPNEEHWLIATAKEGDALFVYKAANGEFIIKVGEPGTQPGQLARPNGVFVIDDLAIVVERDNRRIQVLDLPEFNSLGFIGDTLLINPYGLFVHKLENGDYSMYVTDNYETVDEKVPPDDELGKRVHHYNFSLNENQLDWTLVKQFGEASGAGVLRIVESIWADVEHNRLLIAEEDETQSSVKVYDLQGNFTGIIFGRDVFNYQVEGIALYETDPETGYWIITDQSHENNRFHIFSRKNFKYVATFTAPNTTNTDGIWLSPVAFGDFSKGVFFAVHNDGNVSAIDWESVINITGIND